MVYRSVKNQSFKPYFLSAFHCIDVGDPTLQWPQDEDERDGILQDYEITNAENWMFKFQFKKATCGGTNATRLSNWLNPNNSGITTINTARPPSISGSTLVCSSGSSFTINNLPTGATITWSQGPNLTRTSAQGAHPCTFSATGSGSSWIRATLVIGSDSVTLADKVIWSGPPIISYVTIDGSLTIPEQFCTEQYYIFNAAIPSAYPGIVSYSWTGDNAEILNPDINPVYINFQGVGDYGTATLHISGTCGQATGMYSVTREIINCGGGVIYSVYPNPSDNEITISIPFIESSNAKIYVTIVDISGIVLYQGYSSVGQEIKINVSQWNPGIYTAIFRNEAEINKLLFIVN